MQHMKTETSVGCSGDAAKLEDVSSIRWLSHRLVAGQALKINTVCWSTLLGHVTGFAAINAWGTLQQASQSFGLEMTVRR